MIVVKDPRSVFTKCKNLLSDNLDTDYFDFVKKGSSFAYALIGGSKQTGAVAGDVRYAVFPLSLSSEIPFWLAAELNFLKDKEGYKLHTISLVFFEGISTDADKVPLIRAEWDPWEGQGHAQPHWHVYPNGLKQSDQSSQISFGQEHEVRDFDPSVAEQQNDDTRIEIEKFHFPMLGGWHLNPLASEEIQFESEKIACQWIGGCVSYTRKQLAYLKRVPL